MKKISIIGGISGLVTAFYLEKVIMRNYADGFEKRSVSFLFL